MYVASYAIFISSIIMILFAHHSYSKNVELGLWCVRYISTGMLFILGFLAPGLPSNRSIAEMQRGPLRDEDEVRIES